MRLITLTLMLLIFIDKATASNLQITLSFFNANPTNRTVSYTPQNPMVGDTVFGQSDANGDPVIFNNVPGGLLNCVIYGPPQRIPFQVYIPTNSVGTIDASNCLASGSSATFPAGQVAWAIATSDQRYQFSGTTLSNTFYPLFSNPSNYINQAALTATNAAIVALIPSTNGFSTLQSATNAANGVYSNNPAGYVTQTITNGYATTNYAFSAAVIITNGLATVPYVNSQISTGTNGFATTNYVFQFTPTNTFVTGTNTLAINLTANLNAASNVLLTANQTASNAITAALVATNRAILNATQPTNTILTALGITGANTNQFVPGSNVAFVTNASGNIITINATNAAAWTNGFVTASVTNGLVGPWITNGLVGSWITNGLVGSWITNGLATGNTNQFVPGANIQFVTNASGNIITVNATNQTFLTNGLVNSSVTNGLVGSWVTNGYATVNFVTSSISSSTAPFATVAQLSATNISNLVITTNLVIASTNAGNIVFTNNAIFTNGLTNPNEFVLFTNGNSIALTVSQNLNIGSKTNWETSTNLIGLARAGSTIANGTFVGAAGSTTWTNLNNPSQTIILSGGSFYEESNGIALYQSANVTNWTTVNGVLPAPIGAFTAYWDLDGAYFRGTPYFPWLINYIATNGGGGGGTNGTTNFLLSGVVTSWTTNNAFSAAGSNTIAAIAIASAGGSATNAIPLLNGIGTNTTLTTAKSVASTNLTAYGTTWLNNSNLVISLTTNLVAGANGAIIPVMTATNAPSGYAYSSVITNGVAQQWYAFTGTNNTWADGVYPYPSVTNTSAFVGYEFTNLQTVVSFSAWGGLSYGNVSVLTNTPAGSVVFYGSQDNVHFTPLYAGVITNWDGIFPSTNSANYFTNAISGTWNYFLVQMAGPLYVNAGATSNPEFFAAGVQVFGPGTNTYPAIIDLENSQTNVLELLSSNGIAINTNNPSGYALNVAGQINNSGGYFVNGVPVSQNAAPSQYAGLGQLLVTNADAGHITANGIYSLASNTQFLFTNANGWNLGVGVLSGNGFAYSDYTIASNGLVNFISTNGLTATYLPFGFTASSLLVSYISGQVPFSPTNYYPNYTRGVNPQSFGAVPISNTNQESDLAENTAAIQAAINYCEKTGLPLNLNAMYRITGTLLVTNAITIQGSGCAWTPASWATGNYSSLAYPLTYPYITGSGLVECGTNVDVFDVTNVGSSFNAFNFGIRFGTNVAFQTTGRGIYCAPPLVPNSTNYDNGIHNSYWQNISVWGNDGNHSAFHTINGMYNQFDHLNSVGGGGLVIECNGTNQLGNTYYPGNTTVNESSFVLCTAGTAKGVWMKSANTSGGTLEAVSLNRVQCITWNASSDYPWTTPLQASSLTATQNVFQEDYGQILVTIGPGCAFENTGGGGQAIFNPSSGGEAFPMSVPFLLTNFTSTFGTLRLTPHYFGSPISWGKSPANLLITNQILLLDYADLNSSGPYEQGIGQGYNPSETELFETYQSPGTAYGWAFDTLSGGLGSAATRKVFIDQNGDITNAGSMTVGGTLTATNLTGPLNATNVFGFFPNLYVGNLYLSTLLNATNLGSGSATAGTYLIANGSGGVSWGVGNTNYNTIGQWQQKGDGAGNYDLTNSTISMDLTMYNDTSVAFGVGQGSSAAGGGFSLLAGASTNYSVSLQTGIAGVSTGAGFDFASQGATAQGGYSVVMGQNSLATTNAPNAFIGGPYNTVNGGAVNSGAEVVGAANYVTGGLTFGYNNTNLSGGIILGSTASILAGASGSYAIEIGNGIVSAPAAGLICLDPTPRVISNNVANSLLIHAKNGITLDGGTNGIYILNPTNTAAVSMVGLDANNRLTTNAIASGGASSQLFVEYPTLAFVSASVAASTTYVYASPQYTMPNSGTFTASTLLNMAPYRIHGNCVITNSTLVGFSSYANNLPFGTGTNVDYRLFTNSYASQTNFSMSSYYLHFNANGTSTATNNSGQSLNLTTNTTAILWGITNSSGGMQMVGSLTSEIIYTNL